MDEATIEGQASETTPREATTEPGPLTIRRERKGSGCLIRLYGELDLATAAALEKAVSDASATGVSEVVLDLSALCFIDASGLRSIVRPTYGHDAVERRPSTYSADLRTSTDCSGSPAFTSRCPS